MGIGSVSSSINPLQPSVTSFPLPKSALKKTNATYRQITTTEQENTAINAFTPRENLKLKALVAKVSNLAPLLRNGDRSQLNNMIRTLERFNLVHLEVRKAAAQPGNDYTPAIKDLFRIRKCFSDTILPHINLYVNQMTLRLGRGQTNPVESVSPELSELPFQELQDKEMHELLATVTPSEIQQIKMVVDQLSIALSAFSTPTINLSKKNQERLQEKLDNNVIKVTFPKLVEMKMNSAFQAINFFRTLENQHITDESKIQLSEVVTDEEGFVVTEVADKQPIYSHWPTSRPWTPIISNFREHLASNTNSGWAGFINQQNYAGRQLYINRTITELFDEASVNLLSKYDELTKGAEGAAKKVIQEAQEAAKEALNEAKTPKEIKRAEKLAREIPTFEEEFERQKTAAEEEFERQKTAALNPILHDICDRFGEEMLSLLKRPAGNELNDDTAQYLWKTKEENYVALAQIMTNSLRGAIEEIIPQEQKSLGIFCLLKQADETIKTDKILTELADNIVKTLGLLPSQISSHSAERISSDAVDSLYKIAENLRKYLVIENSVNARMSERTEVFKQLAPTLATMLQSISQSVMQMENQPAITIKEVCDTLKPLEAIQEAIRTCYSKRLETPVRNEAEAYYETSNDLEITAKDVALTTVREAAAKILTEIEENIDKNEDISSIQNSMQMAMEDSVLSTLTHTHKPLFTIQDFNNALSQDLENELSVATQTGSLQPETVEQIKNNWSHLLGDEKWKNWLQVNLPYTPP